jgi:hypothetical protein
LPQEAADSAQHSCGITPQGRLRLATAGAFRATQAMVDLLHELTCKAEYGKGRKGETTAWQRLDYSNQNVRKLIDSLRRSPDVEQSFLRRVAAVLN